MVKFVSSTNIFRISMLLWLQAFCDFYETSANGPTPSVLSNVSMLV